MSDSTTPSRKALKMSLSLSTPAGDEYGVLERAEADLKAAQEAVRALRLARSRNERDISVRERKIADWKGKIPFTGTPSVQSAQLALNRANKMPWQVIAIATARSGAEGTATTLTLRHQFRRALSGLQGFSHVWVLAVGSNGVVAHVHAIDHVDIRAGLVHLMGVSLLGDRAREVIIDVKPYLRYCDAWTTQG